MGSADVAFGIANPALCRLMSGQAFPSGDGLPPAPGDAVGRAHRVILAVALDGSFDIDPNDPAELRAASAAA